MKKPAYASIDEYIAQFPDHLREILYAIRNTIRQAAPQAKERISWQMPTFWQNENLIHFAAAKNHIGLYPGESGIRAFQDKLTGYPTSNGAIRRIRQAEWGLRSFIHAACFYFIVQRSGRSFRKCILFIKRRVENHSTIWYNINASKMK